MCIPSSRWRRRRLFLRFSSLRRGGGRSPFPPIGDGNGNGDGGCGMENNDDILNDFLVGVTALERPRVQLQDGGTMSRNGAVHTFV